MLTKTDLQDTEAVLIQVPTKILAELDLIAPNQEPFNGPLRVQEYIGKVVTEIFEKELDDPGNGRKQGGETAHKEEQN